MQINRFTDFLEYSVDEFRIDRYSTGEKGKTGITGWVVRVTHLPSGKISRVISSSDVPPVEYPLATLAQELVKALREADIAPQPPKVGVKKLGKPRWSK
jgi:hypothetical protein